jgi:hypothetical protein
MNEPENVQVVQQLYSAFGRGDVSAVLTGFSEDAEWEVAGPAHLAICGSRRGRDGVGDFFRALGQLFDTEQFEPREFIAQGDKVVVLGHERHRVRSTGRIFEDEWVQVFTLRKATVIRYREYIDTAALVEALRPV